MRTEDHHGDCSVSNGDIEFADRKNGLGSSPLSPIMIRNEEGRQLTRFAYEVATSFLAAIRRSSVIRRIAMISIPMPYYHCIHRAVRFPPLSILLSKEQVAQNPRKVTFHTCRRGDHRTHTEARHIRRVVILANKNKSEVRRISFVLGYFARYFGTKGISERHQVYLTGMALS